MNSKFSLPFHTIAMILCFGLLAMALWRFLDMPVVSINSNNECVRVESPESDYSCEELPKKYILQRVR